MAFDNSFTAVTGATYTAAQYNTYVRDNLDALFSKIENQYPIGMIIELYVSTNPATLFGYGTWVAHGPGRVVVGYDATQTEFDTVGEEGGEKTHALTSSENGPHTHTVTVGSLNNQYVNSGAVAAAYNLPNSGNTGSSGSGTPHNNLQPYTVAYRWRRTA